MIFGSISKYLFEHVAGNINNSFCLLIVVCIGIFQYLCLYSENQKILEQEDDFKWSNEHKTQKLCRLKLHVSATSCFVNTSNVRNYCYNAGFLFHTFLFLKSTNILVFGYLKICLYIWIFKNKCCLNLPMFLYRLNLLNKWILFMFYKLQILASIRGFRYQLARIRGFRYQLARIRGFRYQIARIRGFRYQIARIRGFRYYSQLGSGANTVIVVGHWY